MLKQLGTVLVVTLIGSQAIGATSGSWVLTFVLCVVTATLAVLAYGWVVRRTEHRAPVEVGRAGAAGALGRGALLGILMCGAVIASIALGGGYRVDGTGSVTAAVGMLGLAVVAGTTEELLFRGVLFRIIEERGGTWIALLVTAVLFGGMHLANPNATVWGAAAIAISAGGMLGAAYVATRTLWLPIGLHLGWNFATAGIFGTEVSGTTSEPGLLDGVTSGPTLLSGGAFGPEASVYTVLAGAVLTAVFLGIAHRRGTLVPRRARAAQPVATATLGA
jgi:membrane protease YdiL (CAAX protease family)